MGACLSQQIIVKVHKKDLETSYNYTCMGGVSLDDSDKWILVGSNLMLSKHLEMKRGIIFLVGQMTRIKGSTL
jgi:hypothetical protein